MNPAEAGHNLASWDVWNVRLLKEIQIHPLCEVKDSFSNQRLADVSANRSRVGKIARVRRGRIRVDVHASKRAEARHAKTCGQTTSAAKQVDGCER